MQRRPARARPAFAAAPGVHVGSVTNQQTRCVGLPPKQRGMQRRDSERMTRDGVDVRAAPHQKPQGFGMPEMRGQRERREPFRRIRIQQGSVFADQLGDAIGLPDGGGFVNVGLHARFEEQLGDGLLPGIDRHNQRCIAQPIARRQQAAVLFEQFLDARHIARARGSQHGEHARGEAFILRRTALAQRIRHHIQQHFAQPLPRGKESLLDRGDRDIEEGADFGLRISAQIKEHHRRAFVFGQRVNRRPDLILHFPLLQRFVLHRRG
ncbi:MAG: hypothetical protein JMDDDDMK_04759 [Acidobacteria bacterium]|nr:hypothetical protein [Acidobacteriota bacterium]